MDIEKLATSAVTGYISKTDYLSPFINEGDKEPSWDGNIYVFNNSSRSKCYLMGEGCCSSKRNICRKACTQNSI